jgi:hypothetical protein
MRQSRRHFLVRSNVVEVNLLIRLMKCVCVPTRTIVHDRCWRILVTRKTITRGHVAFDTYGLFRKIAVCLDPPYLQQIASIRKMPTYAIACRTSIRRFKRANYQFIEHLNFVQNRIFSGGMYQVPDQCTKIVHTQCKLVHTQCKIVYKQNYWYLI